ncbi:MAG: dockerin type I repeat-containing protein [Acutalibacteraceae bacterium]
MKKNSRTKKYYLLLIIALLSIASLLCGATLIGISMNTPTGTKLNISVGSSTKLIPKKDEGYFLIQNQEQSTYVALLSEQGYILQEQTFNRKYNEVCYSADYLYILMSDSEHKSSIITYQLSDTSVTNYQTTELSTALYSFTTSQDGTIYGIDYWDRHSLLAYTNVSEKTSAQPILLNTFEASLDKLCTSPDGILYVALKDNTDVYTASISQGLPYHFNLHQTDTDIPSFSPHTLTNDILMIVTVTYINCTQTSFIIYFIERHLLYKCMSSYGYQYFSFSCIKRIFRGMDFNGTMQNRYQIKGECIAMATNAKDTGILLKQEDSLYFITLSELSRIENTPDSSEPNSSEFDSVSSTTNESDHENDQSSHSDSSSSNYPYQLESDTFLIDRSNNTIFLPPATTFAVLRDSLNSTKDTIIMKNLSGTTINSGNLGTSYTVALEIDGSIVDKLTIIVKGDINGTGTVNSRDVQLLYDQLNGSETLSDIQLLACDMNSDELIDTSDLLLLKQQIVSAQ